MLCSIMHCAAGDGLGIIAGAAGGSYSRSLQMPFIPELLSMNVLMAGMQFVARLWI